MKDKWQAESDAYTLMQAELIKKNSTRKKNAKAVMQKLVQEKQKEATALATAKSKLTGAATAKKKPAAKTRKSKRK